MDGVCFVKAQRARSCVFECGENGMTMTRV
jgi:hypothetical protein